MIRPSFSGPRSIRAPGWLAIVCLSALIDTVSGQGPVNRSLLAPSAQAASEAEQGLGAEVVSRAASSIVNVSVWVEASNFKFERDSSGVVIDRSGLVVTSHELVREAVGEGGELASGYAIELRFLDGAEFSASLLAVDAASGLALLQFDPGARTLSHLECGDSIRAVSGEPAFVLGNPRGENLVAVGGVVLRASGGTKVGNAKLSLDQILLTDAPMERTADGAALLDANSRLLGLCVASHIEGTAVVAATVEEMERPSFGFAISVDTIRQSFRGQFRGVANGSLRTAPPEDSAEVRRRLAGPADALSRVSGGIVSVVGNGGERPDIGEMDPYATLRRPGLGSGVLVHSAGLVLTNAHLMADSMEARVILRDGRSFTAEVVRGFDDKSNVALLQLELPAGTVLPDPVDIGDVSRVVPGQTVIGVGNPYGTALTTSVGVVSALREQFLQVDADLGNHNGGGALLDLDGQLLGLIDAGSVDRLEQIAQRAQVTESVGRIQTNLGFVLGIDAVLRQIPGLADVVVGRDARPPGAAGGLERFTVVPDMVRDMGGAVANVDVYISTTQSAASDNPFAPPVQKAATLRESLGSAVIISTDGLVLTNEHVVREATLPNGVMAPDRVVKVRLRDGRELGVDVLSISREDDLALLRLRLGPGESVQAIELGDSDALEIGATVIAVGNPIGLENSVTVGVVTAKDRAINVQSRFAKLEGLIETDAPINGGNSGGALLDTRGRLVGINSAGGSGRSRTSYAIAVNQVRDRLNRVLLSSKKLRSVYTGMKVGDDGRYVVVREIEPSSPAVAAGVRVGDRLLTLDREDVTWSVGMKLMLLGKSQDQLLSLVALREREQVVLSLRPKSTAARAVVEQTGMECSLVARVLDANDVLVAWDAMYRRFGLETPAVPDSLVQVQKVSPGTTPAGSAVESGDLLMAVVTAKRDVSGEQSSLHPFVSLEDVQDFFDDQDHYDSPLQHSYKVFTCWIYRRGVIVVEQINARRLLY